MHLKTQKVYVSLSRSKPFYLAVSIRLFVNITKRSKEVGESKMSTNCLSELDQHCESGAGVVADVLWTDL